MSEYTPDTSVIHACYLECTDWASYEGKSVSEVSNERDAEFDRWLAEVIRKAKEEAWEEGWGNGNVYGMNRSGGRQENFDNPYRQRGTE